MPLSEIISEWEKAESEESTLGSVLARQRAVELVAYRYLQDSI